MTVRKRFFENFRGHFEKTGIVFLGGSFILGGWFFTGLVLSGLIGVTARLLNLDELL